MKPMIDLTSRRRLRRLVLLVLFVGGVLSNVAACVTPVRTGIMKGDWTPPEGAARKRQVVTLSWESREAARGSIRFTLGPEGERFTGSYALMRSEEADPLAQPIYDDWVAGSEVAWALASQGWFVPGWSLNTFSSYYDGRVVAGLTGDRGGSARCLFDFTDVARGMDAGGSGECAISDGGHLAVQF